MIEYKLMEHQKQAILESSIKPDLFLAWEMGCISGSAKVRVNRGGSSRELFLSDLYKKFKKSWDKKIPTKIRANLGTHVGLIEVKDVIFSGVKKVYELTLSNGKKLRATGDHEIYTKEGFKKLKALLPGDKVCVDTLKKHQKKKHKRKKVRSSNNYKTLRVGPRHPYGRKIKGQPGRRDYTIQDTHRLVVEAWLNNMELAEFIKATYKPNKLKFIDPEKFHVHHINHNKFDNGIENLEILTKEEHLKHHGNYAHFGHGSLRFSKVKSVKALADKEEVFDIICEAPYRNFAANGIIVHNCGKTCAVINMLRQRYAEESRLRNTLIFAPLIVLKNWKKEFKMFSKISQNAIVVLEGPIKKRIAQIKESKGPRILVTNYDAVQNKDFVKALKEWGPEILVCDESHNLKNYKSKRAKAVAEIADLCKHRYLLTGTPILNNALDLFMQFRVLDGYLGKNSTFGTNYFAFRGLYFEDENQAFASKPGHFPKFVPRASTYDILNEKIKHKMLRVLKKDVLKELPPLVVEDRFISMGAEQERAYSQMKRDFVTFVKSKLASGEPRAVVAKLAVTKALRLQEIVSGYAKTEEGDIYRFDDVPRLALLEELLRELCVDHKVIVWAVFKENYKMIREVCEKIGVKCVEIHGDIPNKEKYANQDTFNNDASCRVLIGNPNAGGVGINLVASDYSLYYSRDFKLASDLQSEARNYRKGSEIHEKVTRVNLITPGGIDEIINDALLDKMDISERVIDKIMDI